MRTKADLYKEALHKVESRRQEAVTLAEHKKAAALSAVAGLEEAQDKVRRLGFKAVQMAASGAGQDKVNEMQQQRRRAKEDLEKLMAAFGYGPESLEPKFTCSLCKDTGYVNGRLCSCVAKLAREMRRSDIAAESALALSDFSAMKTEYYPNAVDSFFKVNMRDHMRSTLTALQEYADHFDMKSMNLLITGNSGLGKTHASLAIAKTVLDKGYDVVYVCSQQLFSQLERARFEEAQPLREAVMEADLLILDDLGTEQVTSYMLSCFYDILNTRMLEKRPTIYTSNITDGQKFEARYTEKISSRLAGSCEPVFFLGEDIRPMLGARY